jgi:hypothetical protein
METLIIIYHKNIKNYDYCEWLKKETFNIHHDGVFNHSLIKKVNIVEWKI